jgi:hypothetical protein
MIYTCFELLVQLSSEVVDCSVELIFDVIVCANEFDFGDVTFSADVIAID